MLGDRGCLCKCRYLSDDGMAIDGQTLGVSYTNEGKRLCTWCKSVDFINIFKLVPVLAKCVYVMTKRPRPTVSC